MNFFDEALDKTKEVMWSIGDKTGEILDITKLKYDKSMAEKELNVLYVKLGMITYNSRKTETDNESLVLQTMDGIDKQISKLNKIKGMINERQGTLVCTNCGNKNSNKSMFCSACGEKLL